MKKTTERKINKKNQGYLKKWLISGLSRGNRRYTWNIVVQETKHILKIWLDQSTVKGGIERFRQAGRQHRWTTNIILGKRSQTHIFKSSKQGMHRKCPCWLGLDIKVEIDWNERLKNNGNILKLVLRRNRNSYFFPYLWPLLAKKKNFHVYVCFAYRHVWHHMHAVSAEARGVRFLGLELLAIAGCLEGTWEFKPGSSEKLLEHWSMSPAPIINFFLSKKFYVP